MYSTRQTPYSLIISLRISSRNIRALWFQIIDFEVAESKAWVALGKFLEEFVYLCGRNLSSGHISKCDPKFLSRKKL